MSDSVDISRLSLDEDLQAKHRKERKELQGKIQALKKSADKDKKRKREILEEIVKLELSLEEKHQSELNALNQAQSESIDNPTSADEEPPNESNAFVKTNGSDGTERVSKAQKRRDKKAQAEREKQAEILVQEELNKTGPRMVEMANIKKILTSRKLELHSIPSDGDCLYNAVAHQLIEKGHPPKEVADLRALTADYILDNKDSLIFYMTNPQNGDILSDAEFDKYCQAVRTTPAWGGQIEIKALSNVLAVPIEVLQATGPPTVQNEHGFKGPSLTLTYHRFMYSLGEHYNSTRAQVSAESTDEATDAK